ncbi:hypothetical protein AGMMS50268_24820 [Spirochaetia bacterium]|nr:hypothetical protein AGMMS50268_24820 [Spirochaetia bacterium]
MLKRWVVFLTLLALAMPLSAQTEDQGDLGNFSDINIYVAPAVGGSAREREYFDFNLTEEVKGGGYQLTNALYPDNPAEARDKSDFYITVELEDDEEDPDTHIVTLSLFNTRTGAMLVTEGMGYPDLNEMNEWNLTMIYRLMANAPIQRNITMAEPQYVPVAEQDLGPVPQYWLYVGFRGSYSGRYYQPPPESHYLENRTAGSSFEVAGYAMFQPFKYLGIQGEAIFTMDYITMRNYIQDESDPTLHPRVDYVYQNVSLMIPVVVKATFRPVRARFLIAPLAGVYLNLPLGPMTMPGGGTEDYKFDPLPLGLTAGADFGMRLGPGMLMVNARYSIDTGNVVLANEGTLYRRTQMVSVGLGYEFKLFQKKFAK